ncbi:MAG TPA: hypothetical protein VJM50_24160 [Pyrinomonadaceae bacterium]|nr:hypothetical protein [Pyrinomonadaceae bacterium]
MFDLDKVATYRGVTIYRNGFGEYEAEMGGTGFVYPTLARAKDSIRQLAGRLSS